MKKKLRTGIIYKWTSPSGKSYIGQTINQRRWYKDFFRVTQSYAGFKIDRARRKYGPENFTYEILFMYQSYDVKELCELLDKKEVEFIKRYNAVKNGYNLTYGGQNGYNKVKVREITKRKLSEKITEYYKTHKSATAKPIAQYTKQGKLIKVWDSARVAGLTLNINEVGIRDCAKGKVKSAGSFIWKFVIDGNVPIQIEPFKNIRAIYQYDKNGNLIKVWNTCSEAANAFNYSVSYFNQICNGLNNNELEDFKFYKTAR